ncbi:alpha/beta hydrolase [Planctomonas sp. JC2975]|uniref:alpha/beta fold hydrolase n=1 Tax=Planctomonas sp. JC2975 TaxID=2729626 RepID=UPI001472DDEE|nr:alpha/beta fold hydrolase [Planctomonas sp. JC2975]NNC12274.1 alpha/beta hydrolase [Planctomonas sp. JC2975]
MTDNTEPQQVETRWVTTEAGDRVAYEVRGEGRPVIFIAGAGPYRASDPTPAITADLMAERGISTILYDRVGRGESVADGTLTLDRELSAIAALIDVSGGHAVLWGQSSGSVLALRAAVDGLAVDGLALWEAPVQQSDDTTAWARGFGELIDAGDLLGALQHYMKDLPPERLEQLKASPRFEEILATVPSQRSDADAIAWAGEAIPAGRFADITVPVLAMTGVVTRPAMAASASAIASAVPNGRAVTVGGARHRWEPDAMASAVADFASSL